MPQISALNRTKRCWSCSSVVSLSNIDFIHRSGNRCYYWETAIGKKVDVLGDRSKGEVVQHGFESLGLRRIGGGQAMPIAIWQIISYCLVLDRRV